MRTSVRAIVVKDGHLLVNRRIKDGYEYYTLVGGGVEADESREAALHRELQEETGLKVKNPRLVIELEAGPRFGFQPIYLCEYESGEPKLDPVSIEAQLHASGQSFYEPLWLPIAALPATNLLPVELKKLLVQYLQTGFPDRRPVRLRTAA